MKKQYIGQKQIKNREKDGDIVMVEFTDKTEERFTALMLKHVVTDKRIDATELRNIRTAAVAEVMLEVLRDWGVKIGEVNPIVQLLNDSIKFNFDQAELTLWGEWTPKPKALDDISLLDADAVLKSQKFTLDDITSDGLGGN